MAAWPEPFYRGSAVLSALRDLFDQFEAEQEAKQSRGLAPGARPVIDPTPLREALAALPQGHLFAQGGLALQAERVEEERTAWRPAYYGGLYRLRRAGLVPLPISQGCTNLRPLLAAPPAASTPCTAPLRTKQAR